MSRDTLGHGGRGQNTHLPDSAWDGLGAEISAKIETLAGITDEPGKLTRLYLNPAHRRAIDVVMGWMREAGLEARLDATGSVIGRLAGTGAVQKSLLLGSHIDTVRDAGKYDGTLGVLAALAVVGRLTRHGVRMPFDIEVVAFGDEEGVRFPSTLSGSRALAGKFDPRILDEVDQSGIRRRDGLVAFGCNPAAIVEETCDPERMLGYVEVHIEQGPVLEARNLRWGL